MRKTTEARVFTMACDLLLGQSRKSVAAKFGITEKHLSRLLCTPEAKEILVHLIKQVADAIIAEWIRALNLRNLPSITAADILRKLGPKNVRKNVDNIDCNR